MARTATQAELRTRDLSGNLDRAVEELNAETE
jgi:hypothetical protein